MMADRVVTVNVSYDRQVLDAYVERARDVLRDGLRAAMVVRRSTVLDAVDTIRSAS